MIFLCRIIKKFFPTLFINDKLLVKSCKKVKNMTFKNGFRFYYFFSSRPQLKLFYYNFHILLVYKYSTLLNPVIIFIRQVKFIFWIKVINCLKLILYFMFLLFLSIYSYIDRRVNAIIYIIYINHI